MLNNDKIEPVWNAEVTEVKGDNSGMKSVQLKDRVSGEERSLDLEGLFIAIGVTPKAQFLAELLELDSEGYIQTDTECRTSIPGVFAAGDVRKKILKQIATAVGDGAIAAIMVEKYLDDLDG